jgi:hypothetical protein
MAQIKEIVALFIDKVCAIGDCQKFTENVDISMLLIMGRQPCFTRL